MARSAAASFRLGLSAERVRDRESRACDPAIGRQVVHETLMRFVQHSRELFVFGWLSTRILGMQIGSEWDNENIDPLVGDCDRLGKPACQRDRRCTVDVEQRGGDY